MTSSLKAQLIEAHRTQDWETAKLLSQAKQAEKREREKRPTCMDCGTPVSPNNRRHVQGETVKVAAQRCGLCARQHRYYGKALTATL